MIFDDDFLQLEFAGGTKRATARGLGFTSWPPPEKINVMGFDMIRVSASEITDDQRKELTMVMRGARYVPAEPTTNNKEQDHG